MKEKLIITGISKDNEKENKKMLELIDIYQKDNGKINPLLIKKYKSYKEWIKLVYLYNKENIKDKCSLKIYSKCDIISEPEKEESEEKSVIMLLEEKKLEEEKIKKIKKELEYEYKYSKSTIIPNKISVTKIKEIKSKIETKKDVIITTPKFLKELTIKL